MSIDLSTQYGPLTLHSPVIVGSCPLTAESMMRVSMISAGAGALVLPSLFEEQVILWNGRNGHMALSPNVRDMHDRHVLQRAVRMRIDTVCKNAECYLDLVRRSSSEVSIPVIASLNGECDGNWEAFSEELEQAGAAGIEFHVRQPPPQKYDDPREIEDAIVDTAASISRAISIPLFLKLGRNYTSISGLSRRLHPHVSGLVLFGQSPRTDIDLDNLQLTSSWALTQPGSIARSLDAIIRVHEYCPKMALAANGGIGCSGDLIKVLLAGASVGMITSSVYRNGATVIGNMIEGLIGFMNVHQMQSLAELQANNPLNFDSDSDRIEYIKAFSAKSESTLVRESTPTLECDRWGHPRSIR
jgi:dihydroorotate dehydrogenase (fumarate)